MNIPSSDPDSAWFTILISAGAFWGLTLFFLALAYWQSRTFLRKNPPETEKDKTALLASFNKAASRRLLIYVLALIAIRWLYFDNVIESAYRSIWETLPFVDGDSRIYQILFQIFFQAILIGRFLLGFVLIAIPGHAVDKQLRGSHWSLKEFLSTVIRMGIFRLQLWFFLVLGIGLGGLWGAWGIGIGSISGLVLGLGMSQFFVRFIWPMTEMPAGPLLDKLQELYQAAGVRIRKTLVMENANSRISNAMVFGLGSRFRRIAFTRTFLDKFSEPEIVAVAAHELGHVIHHHVAKRLLSVFVSLAAMIGSVFYVAWNFKWEPWELFLFSITLNVLLLPALYGRLNRAQELEADREAARLTGDPVLVSNMLEKLTTSNFQVRKWSGWQKIVVSHPSLETRLENLRKLDPSSLVAEPNASSVEAAFENPGEAAVPAESTQPKASSRPWLLAVLASILLIYWAFETGQRIWQKRLAEIQAREAEQIENKKIHDDLEAKISNLLTNGKSLPSCPLLFPLLDEHGNLNQVGTYLSYLAMKRASFIPEPVLRIPNAGVIFSNFELFSPHPGPVAKVYLQELPFRFMSTDFGEGVWKRIGNQYVISIRFKGRGRNKSYRKTFAKGKLNRAPDWMAACIQNWMSFQVDDAQKSFMSNPIFTNDSDFFLAAKEEYLFWIAPAIVTGWDKIQEKNKDNSFLMDRWLAILQHRLPQAHDLVRSNFAKNPKDYFYRAHYFYYLMAKEEYQDATNLAFEDVTRDDNNSLYYGELKDVLEDWKRYDEAIDLTKAWIKLHPDNQEAWMQLGDLYYDYAWEARGNGFANTVTKEGWKLKKERTVEAEKAYAQAAIIAPRDCRVWAKMVGLGVGVELSKQHEEDYFEKVLALNPYQYKAYTSYLNYIQPKWFGSDQEVSEFLKRYEERFPTLIVDAAHDSFWDDVWDKPQDIKATKLELRIQGFKESPYGDEFKRDLEAHLKRYPEDLDSWADYFYWTTILGLRDQDLAFARQVIPKNDPILAGLYPYLINSALEQESYDRNDVEFSAFQKDPEMIRLNGEGYRGQVEADPHDWGAWNRLAKWDTEHGEKEETRKALKAIGDNVDERVWTKTEFEKVKRLYLTAKN